MSSNEPKKRMLLHSLAAKTTKTSNEGHGNLAVYATVVCSERFLSQDGGWMDDAERLPHPAWEVGMPAESPTKEPGIMVSVKGGLSQKGRGAMM